MSDQRRVRSQRNFQNIRLSRRGAYRIPSGVTLLLSKFSYLRTPLGVSSNSKFRRLLAPLGVRPDPVTPHGRSAPTQARRRQKVLTSGRGPALPGRFQISSGDASTPEALVGEKPTVVISRVDLGLARRSQAAPFVVRRLACDRPIIARSWTEPFLTIGSRTRPAQNGYVREGAGRD